MPLQLQHSVQLEKQQKKDKNKLKKYDQALKKSLGVLQRLGQQLSVQVERKRSMMMSTVNDDSEFNARGSQHSRSQAPRSKSKMLDQLG